MTVKETIVEIIQSQGYDMMTACKLADDCIKEFLESREDYAVYYIGNRSFEIRRKEGLK